MTVTPDDAICPQSDVSGHNDHLLLVQPWMSDVRHSQTIIKLLLFDDYG